MNKEKKHKYSPVMWLAAAGRVFRNEWRLIMHDPGALLFFIVLPLLYPITYTLIYNPEVVREMPVAVVDNSRSEASRRLVRNLGAAPQVEIGYYCADMAEAKDLFGSNKVFAILEIPEDYAKKIGRGEPAHASFFAEMSLLLRYRGYLEALTSVQLEEISTITSEKLKAAGMSSAGVSGMPVEQHNNFIGDPGQGFASFIMPGIVVLILQQGTLLGICFLYGTSRERRRRNRGYDPQEPKAPVGATLLGRTLCYVLMELPMLIYVTIVIPEMFALPHHGAIFDYVAFLLPMLLATAFMGQTLQVFCSERESAFLVVVFTSVVFLFLSGLTWPRYAMDGFFIWFGNLIPATHGIEGMIRINSNGATIHDCMPSFLWLWVLTAFYFVLSRWVLARQRKYLPAMCSRAAVTHPDAR